MADVENGKYTYSSSSKTSCAIFLHFSGERGIINSILPNGIYNLSSISILGTHSHSRHSDSGSPVTKK